MTQDFSWAEVGDRIRLWREERGLSQHELAAVAGISQPGLLALERGLTNPQLRTLQGVAAGLDRSVRELMAGTVGDRGDRPSKAGARVERILQSGDRNAIDVIESALRAAEELLERGRRRSGMPRIRVAMGRHEMEALASRAAGMKTKVRVRGLRPEGSTKGGKDKGA